MEKTVSRCMCALFRAIRATIIRSAEPWEKSSPATISIIRELVRSLIAMITVAFPTGMISPPSMDARSDSTSSNLPSSARLGYQTEKSAPEKRGENRYTAARLIASRRRGGQNIGLMVNPPNIQDDESRV